MQQIIKLLMITFLLSSVGFVYAQGTPSQDDGGN